MRCGEIPKLVHKRLCVYYPHMHTESHWVVESHYGMEARDPIRRSSTALKGILKLKVGARRYFFSTMACIVEY